MIVTMSMINSARTGAKNKNYPHEFIILAITLLTSSIIPIHGQFSGPQDTASYTVFGAVKDVNGNPLSYATVTVYDTSGAFVAKTQTLLKKISDMNNQAANH
ncbi:MAG: carboxypeptidase-like regulatory domain-containing protein [Thermoproteota archaeon]